MIISGIIWVSGGFFFLRPLDIQPLSLFPRLHIFHEKNSNTPISLSICSLLTTPPSPPTGFGSVAIVPSLYTIQAQYLFHNPIILPRLQLILTACFGIIGYLIFRDANHQKDLVRRTNGRCKVWGKPAEVIRARYKTEDGMEHESLLLVCGMYLAFCFLLSVLPPTLKYHLAPTPSFPSLSLTY